MLTMNQSLVYLNLSSNNINSECATLLFNSLKDHPTLSELNLSNNDKLHKNRIGSKGCLALRDLLKQNKILTILNIAENSIGAEGIKNIAEGLQSNKVLVSLNLSSNNLPPSCIYTLTPALSHSGLIELILRRNEINDRVNNLTNWIRLWMIYLCLSTKKKAN